MRTDEDQDASADLRAEIVRLTADNAEWDRAYTALNESSQRNFDRAMAAEATVAHVRAVTRQRKTHPMLVSDPDIPGRFISVEAVPCHVLTVLVGDDE